jgi:hypothetical protein
LAAGCTLVAEEDFDALYRLTTHVSATVESPQLRSRLNGSLFL